MTAGVKLQLSDGAGMYGFDSFKWQPKLLELALLERRCSVVCCNLITSANASISEFPSSDYHYR